MHDSDLWAQVEELHPMSYGWALSCCSHNSAEAEDVLQSTYMKILEGRALFDGRSTLKTWLFSVIRLTAVDERRRTWLRRLRLEAIHRESAAPLHEAPHGDAMEQAERAARLREALKRLPDRQREVLHLVFYQDLTVEEAAGVMGVSLGSARTHYERGKRRLGQWLTPAEVSHE